MYHFIKISMAALFAQEHTIYLETTVFYKVKRYQEIV
jgi:hypothetical protein